MAFKELGAQALEPPDLFVEELDLASIDVLLQTQQAVIRGQPVNQAFLLIGLKVAPDLVELLARVAHELASLGDVVYLGRKFE